MDTDQENQMMEKPLVTNKLDEPMLGSNKIDQKLTIFKAIYDFTKLMIPSSLGMVVRNMTNVVTWMFIGRLDNSDYIAGIGLGTFMAYIFFRSIAVGLGGGIHTLCSQAIGAK